MNDCPNCEYHRQRAQLWRDEAYKQAGHPLPERGWVGLTDDEPMQIWDGVIKYAPSEMRIQDFAKAIEAKLKEKNS